MSDMVWFLKQLDPKHNDAATDGNTRVIKSLKFFKPPEPESDE